MRAVVVTRTGGLDALEIKDVPVPVRKPGWVRIKVKAFGVNESEVTTRKGESSPDVTYPRVPGIEGVGVVDEADEDSGLRPGQQVATTRNWATIPRTSHDSWRRCCSRCSPRLWLKRPLRRHHRAGRDPCRVAPMPSSTSRRLTKVPTGLFQSPFMLLTTRCSPTPIA